MTLTLSEAPQSTPAVQISQNKVPRTGVLRRFVRQRLPLAALVFLALLLLVAVFAPQLAPYDPNRANFDSLLLGPTADHWLGTDHLGRDTLSRLIFATRIAVFAGVEAVLIAVVIGVPVGLASGYLGGWIDRLMMRVIDILLALPGLVVALAIIAALGTGLTNAMLAVGFLFSIRLARLVRGSVLSVREELYVDAAELSGAPRLRVVARYVLPNVSAPILVEVALFFGIALLIESTLSFLGVGVQPPQASWGIMLSEARMYIGQQPFLAIPAGVMLTVTVLAFNLTADGLAAALGPVRAGLGRRRAVDHELIPAAVDADAVLAVTDLSVTFPSENGDLPIVRNVSLSLKPGEILGLVGESGSGKSVTALTIMGLAAPGARLRGSICVTGEEMVDADERQLRKIRGARMAMVFQDPSKALNPAMTIGKQIAESLMIHQGMDRAAARNESIALLDRVGVRNPQDRVDDYPHQFSGGMAQRVVIAIALSCNPDVLIADEPTTALDVTTQAQVLDLLRDLRDERGLAILLITHDLGVVADICDKAAVMYAGEIVETADIEDLFSGPRHPYTRALIDATPDGDAVDRPLAAIPGIVPRPGSVPDGCSFADRCTLVMPECRNGRPALRVLESNRESRCIRTQDSAELLEDAR